ncbi:hypothetical protein AYO21_07077 [Fonsecaea monophora]|uniref:Uncharacterized protein n=1 Tax=Fonsecaea monophora TaxID=254056 RepID=A0A177F316_9EURO|nr:hypothetical protein AYO21_07077 [Fonsecaea monophora]OAG38724.1 hypothetical protein AYO21_07077 [Fonsecaea monophora]
MNDLKGLVAIVTGCSSGIGLASSQHFTELGASVFGVDLNQPPEALAAQTNFAFGSFDLLEPSAPQDIVEACVKRFGRADILLNIAGARDNFAGLEKVDPETWNRVMTVNVTVPALLSKYAVAEFKKQKSPGSIINVSSKAGLSGAIAGTAYTASKHAIIGLSKNVAWRYRNDGIRCNAICPGGFLTGGTQAIDPEKIDAESMEHWRPVHLLHASPTGPADPIKAARLLAFLASPQSAQVNGAIIPIDNAWSCT